MPDHDRQLLAEARHDLPDLPGHVWILTSGTTSTQGFKWIALSKAAFLTSAQSVNQHLDASRADKWLLALPTFHVGGLSIYARAHLHDSDVIEFAGAWDAMTYLRQLQTSKATLSSLVPTQLYDLVRTGLPCPKSLRALVIGGGALTSELFFGACELGYPVMASYGMTECCSQIATSNLQSQDLRPLSHVRIQTDGDGHLMIKSEALLTGMAEIGAGKVKYRDPKHDGWFRSEDLGFVDDGILQVHGRGRDQIKISGELVLLPRLQTLLDHFIPGAVVIATADQRSGMTLSAAIMRSELRPPTMDALKSFNEQVLPFERLERVYFVDAIPRTELGKIKVGELIRTLGLT